MAPAVEQLLEQVLAHPGDAGAHRRLGDALLAGGLLTEAAISYQRALAIEPHSVRGHNNLGQTLAKLGRHADAMASYRRAIELNPRYAIAHNNLGILHYEQRDYGAAAAAYRCALDLEPTFAEAHNNLGNTLLKLSRPEEALAHYELAMSTPFNRGRALQDLKRYEAAVASYEQGLQTQPNDAEALSNCASALLSLLRPEEALLYCRRALALKPDFAAAHNNMGGALRGLGRYEEAVAACQRALELQAEDAGALSNLACMMLAFGKYDEAIAYADRAIAIQPTLADAHDQRGGALIGARRPADAVLAYERLLELEPGRKFLPGVLLAARQAGCDWTGYTAACAAIMAGVRAGREVSAPFSFLSMCDEPELHLQCARIYCHDQVPRRWRQPWSGARYVHERIRVAYVSADFQQHATAVLMAGVFEAHDRDTFEITAVSLGQDDAGPMRKRLQGAFDHFIEARRNSDAEVAQLMRAREIDIAIDLKGYTAEARMGIFARRPAPVQASYLGYPGSLGLESLDYLIADPVVLPSGAHCSEAIAYLPETYQCNDDQRAIDEHAPSRAAAGLPDDAFVFCCFNNNYKIGPDMFAVWMRLLQGLPGSVLWLLGDNADAMRNLRREAEARGVHAERLVFAARAPAATHLARHRLADLFLDTLPYNAHTTASDALWAGLPVLTCLGKAFAGRVAGSLLYAVGLPELVTDSVAAYEARARELAHDSRSLGELRARLARNRTTHPLFDTKRFCRHLEAAFTHMWQRHQSGWAPETFYVPALPVMQT